jgi:NADPH:quinone reductase-like Zn-dependent oxidoreductase
MRTSARRWQPLRLVASTRVADGALWLTLEQCCPSLNRAPNRRLCEDQQPAPALPFAKLLYANTTIETFSIFGMSQAQKQAAIDGVNDLLAQGALEHKIGARFGFDDMIDAHEAMETGSVDGACIVSMRG